MDCPITLPRCSIWRLIYDSRRRRRLDPSPFNEVVKRDIWWEEEEICEYPFIMFFHAHAKPYFTPLLLLLFPCQNERGERRFLVWERSNQRVKIIRSNNNNHIKKVHIARSHRAMNDSYPSVLRAAIYLHTWHEIIRANIPPGSWKLSWEERLRKQTRGSRWARSR